MLNIVDDATRYQWTKNLKTAKTDDVIIQHIKELKIADEIIVRRIRCDNRIVTNKFTAFCEEEGIRLETIAPHRHHMGGVIERANRTTRDRTAVILGDGQLGADKPIMRTILRILDAKTRESLENTTLPEKLWPEAYHHAVYLKNRTPTRALKSDKTPYKALYSRKPDISILQP